MTETLARSLAKTIAWRAIGTAITLVIVYLFTGSISKASVITITTGVFLAMAYYIHERFWDHIEWGRRTLAYAKNYSK